MSQHLVMGGCDPRMCDIVAQRVGTDTGGILKQASVGSSDARFANSFASTGRTVICLGKATEATLISSSGW